jgi:hypothetical protein
LNKRAKMMRTRNQLSLRISGNKSDCGLRGRQPGKIATEIELEGKGGPKGEQETEEPKTYKVM